MKSILPILLGILLLSTNAHSQTEGNCLNLDGVDDYVSCPLPSIFTNIGSTDFTIELWVMPAVGNFERVFFAQNDSDNFAVISLNGTGEIVFYLMENGINHSVQSSSTLNPLEWVHLAVTWNSSTQEAKIFENGNEVPYLGGLYVSSTGTDNSMSIGAKTDGAQPFTGELEELAIWSIAKSECEVRFEMKDKKTGTVPNLVSYYSFDHGADSSPNPGVDYLQDITGNFNDGTLINFALTGSTSNWILSGATIIRFWGDESPLFLGQLGLVPTVDADNYQWINCNTGAAIVGATNITFDPPSEDPNYAGATGGYYAVISTQGNCVDTSECYVFGTGSTNELTSLKLEIYPNPSKGTFFIELPIGAEEVQILSLNGQLIKRFIPNGASNMQIELLGLSGLYLVRVKTQSAVISSKISIQND